MSDVTFAICHFRFSPIGLEIFVSNPHPSLFFETPVFIFRRAERLSREGFEGGASQYRRYWRGASQQRRTWRWSASEGIVSQSEVVGTWITTNWLVRIANWLVRSWRSCIYFSAERSVSERKKIFQRGWSTTKKFFIAFSGLKPKCQMSLSRFVTFDFRQSASKFSCPIPTPHYFLRPLYLFFVEQDKWIQWIIKRKKPRDPTMNQQKRHINNNGNYTQTNPPLFK